jgi:predicted MFS family arabinose efflux permease
VVFGFMMLSLCKEFWQAMLAQGFCIGLGGGMLFVPSVAILPTYFSTKIGLAIGLAAAGSSMGGKKLIMACHIIAVANAPIGIIYPIVFYRLLPQIGFGWSVRVLGFMAFATLLIPIFVMKMRVQPPKARSLLDNTVFADVPFMTFVVGAMIGFIGLYVELFYISFFGQATGFTNSSMSFYLVPILNAGSVFGRTLPNILSDRIGPLNVIIPGAFICAILVFCNMAVENLGGIVVQALLFGFFSGIFIALPPVCFFSLTADKTKLGTRLGMGFAVIALGVLAGGPGGGGILQADPENLNWTGTWAYSGATLIAAGAIFLVVRFLKVGTKLMVKV